MGGMGARAGRRLEGTGILLPHDALFIVLYLYLHSELYHGIFRFQAAGCNYFRNYLRFV